MNKFGIIFILCAITSGAVLTSCEKPANPQEDKTEQIPEEHPNDNSSQEDPSGLPFTLKVYDISSTTATVEVVPADKNAAYYTDIINEADFLLAQKNGFDDYMGWFINHLMNQMGKSKEDVIEIISSHGNDGFILTTLKPDTNYYAFAVGIDENGLTTTDVISEAFKTDIKKQSDNIITLNANNITYNLADINIVTTNQQENYLLTVEPASIISDMSDDELTDYIIHSNIAWGGLEQITYSGTQTIEWMGKAGWDYVAIAFGYENGAVTTAVSKCEFTMAEGGNPAECSFTFSQTFDNFQMNLTISPSDKSVVYIANYIEMSDLQELMKNSGGLDGAFRECLDMLIEDMESDLGSRERVIDLISIMEEQTFSIGYKYSAEYIQWAVPVDQDGNPVADFQFSDPFMTPEENISDATLTLKEYKYYDCEKLAEIYPEEFGKMKGYALVDMTVEPSENAVQWWSYVALEDLTDRSRQVIIKNLTNAPTEEGLTRQYVVAFWGTNTIMGVAQDAEGAYGELLMEVIDLNKEGAAPASEFIF